MAKAADVESQARGFAERASELLNRTVAHGVRLGATKMGTGAAVGRGLGKNRQRPLPVGLTIGDAPPSAWLLVSYSFRLDEGSGGLVASWTDLNLYADEGMQRPVVRFEYERGKATYPEAHIQVHGESEQLAEIRARRDMKADTRFEGLHLPVGGRRFRPTLEDVVEFLVIEKLADAHEGWERTVNEERREWHRIQLAAAVRRDPETARQALNVPLSGE